jgi:hypothetical protein
LNKLETISQTLYAAIPPPIPTKTRWGVVVVGGKLGG